MSEQSIFFTTDAQVKNILSVLKALPFVRDIRISRVRRPYLDKTRFKKKVAGTHVIIFKTEPNQSLPFDDDELIGMENNAWGVAKRLETTKKQWSLNESKKWVCGYNEASFDEMVSHLGITSAPEFDTTFEIPADEFFGGIAVLNQMLKEIPVEDWRMRTTGWAKTFLTRCIKAEPIFVIEKCFGDCGASPLVCNDCGIEADKLYVNPDEPTCVCCGGNRDMVNDKCLTCLEDCGEGETHDNLSVDTAI